MKAFCNLNDNCIQCVNGIVVPLKDCILIPCPKYLNFTLFSFIFPNKSAEIRDTAPPVSNKAATFIPLISKLIIGTFSTSLSLTLAITFVLWDLRIDSFSPFLVSPDPPICFPNVAYFPLSSAPLFYLLYYYLDSHFYNFPVNLFALDFVGDIPDHSDNSGRNYN